MNTLPRRIEQHNHAPCCWDSDAADERWNLSVAAAPSVDGEPAASKGRNADSRSLAAAKANRISRLVIWQVMAAYYDERYGLADDFIKVPEFAIPRPDPFGLVPCAR